MWRSGSADPSERAVDFDEFVTVRAEDLLRAAYLIVWDLATAEDLVQECLLRVARRWPRVRRMASPYGYTRRILVNLALDEAPGGRRRSGELAQFDNAVTHSEDASVGAQFAAVEDSATLDESLSTLTARQRAVLTLRYFHDLTEQQTAEVLGCSVGTVKSTTSRALDRLRADIAAGAHAPR